MGKMKPKPFRDLLGRATDLGIDTEGYTPATADKLEQRVSEKIRQVERDKVKETPVERFAKLFNEAPTATPWSAAQPSTDLAVQYVDKAMYTAEPVEESLPRVYLLQATSDPLGAVAAASMMYEGTVVRHLADVTDEQRIHYWEESFKGHLKAPWEFMDFHFMVESVTRAFTHQMVRQRTAVFAQESLRFAVKESIDARPGPHIESSSDVHGVWSHAVEQIWEAYKALIEMGVPAEEARGILPHDTLTRLNYKTNLRNLADHLGNRLCTQAQFEWRLVASQIRKAIREYSHTYGACPKPGRVPRYHSSGWQFEMIADSPIFQPVCFTMGHCPFKASYDRGCTIRDRVDQGQFDEIQPEEWLADPQAGWVR